MHRKSFVTGTAILATAGLAIAAMGPRLLSDTPIMGMSPDAVIARLGAPDAISAGPAQLEFGYKQGQDESSDYRVVFHDGAVVFRTARRSAPISAAPIKGKVYPGQSVRDALKILGSPRSTISGTVALTLVYEKQRLNVAHGRVVDIDNPR